MSADTTSDTTSAYEQGVAKLERELAFARRNGAMAARQMHALLVKELRTTERQLRQARIRAAKLRRRAESATAEAAAAKRRAQKAEKELAAIKASPTWKAGRAVVAVPARIRRPRRG
jgi:hypothetical protein